MCFWLVEGKKILQIELITLHGRKLYIVLLAIIVSTFLSFLSFAEICGINITLQALTIVVLSQPLLHMPQFANPPLYIIIFNRPGVAGAVL